MQLLARVRSALQRRRGADDQGEPLTAQQITAYAAGRRLYRLGNIGYMSELFDIHRHHFLLRRRERQTALLMGDDEFNHWARQGAVSQYMRSVKHITGG